MTSLLGNNGRRRRFALKVLLCHLLASYSLFALLTGYQIFRGEWEGISPADAAPAALFPAVAMPVPTLLAIHSPVERVPFLPLFAMWGIYLALFTITWKLTRVARDKWEVTDHAV